MNDISFDLHSIEIEYDKIKLFNETLINYYGVCTIMINDPSLKKYFECTGTEFIYDNSNYSNHDNLDKLDPYKNQYIFHLNPNPVILVNVPYGLTLRSNFVLKCILNYNTITIELIKNRSGNKWTKEINILEKKLNILFPESIESSVQ